MPIQIFKASNGFSNSELVSEGLILEWQYDFYNFSGIYKHSSDCL
jgi:hypothetical protein